MNDPFLGRRNAILHAAYESGFSLRQIDPIGLKIVQHIVSEGLAVLRGRRYKLLRLTDEGRAAVEWDFDDGPDSDV